MHLELSEEIEEDSSDILLEQRIRTKEEEKG